MIPTLAVVDSRNVFNQARAVVGVGGVPSVQGVIDALAPYGFDVKEVHIGLALVRSRDRQVLSHIHAENTAYAADVRRDPRGRVLEGEVHQKGSGASLRTEEKIVDVACAVDITDHAVRISQGSSGFQAIVVLSKDIDLRPAYEHAEALGVPIYVAAHDVVHRRDQPFVLLTPASYEVMTGNVLGMGGHALRHRLALAARTCLPGTWTVGRTDGSETTVKHASGLMGVVPTHLLTATRGNTTQLCVSDVDWGDGHGSFPTAMCTTTPPATPCAIEGSVVQRRGPMQLEVRLDDGRTIQKPYQPGGVLPGTKVAVHAATTAIIGPLTDVTASSHPLGTSLVNCVVVKVLKVLSPTTAIAHAHGSRGLLLTGRGSQIAPGMSVAALPIDQNNKGTVYLTMSSVLP